MRLRAWFIPSALKQIFALKMCSPMNCSAKGVKATASRKQEVWKRCTICIFLTFGNWPKWCNLQRWPGGSKHSTRTWPWHPRLFNIQRENLQVRHFITTKATAMQKSQLSNVNILRAFFRLRPIRGWIDKPAEITQQNWDRINSVYKKPGQVQVCMYQLLWKTRLTKSWIGSRTDLEFAQSFQIGKKLQKNVSFIRCLWRHWCVYRGACRTACSRRLGNAFPFRSQWHSYSDWNI